MALLINLNSRIVNPSPAPYNAALAAAIAAVPDVTPFLLGCFDAETGKACQPAAYYDKDGDRAAYVEGWREAVDSLEYAEDIADRAWHARGAW